MVVNSGENACSAGSSGTTSVGSPGSCSDCQRLVASLTRQAEAMERLADLLPQLVAANMALVEALTHDDDDRVSTYLDGSG